MATVQLGPLVPFQGKAGQFRQEFRTFGSTTPHKWAAHDDYAVGYNCYPPSNMTQQSSPNVPLYQEMKMVAPSKNLLMGQFRQLRTRYVFGGLFHHVIIPLRYMLTRTSRIVFASLYHVNYVKMEVKLPPLVFEK